MTDFGSVDSIRKAGFDRVFARSGGVLADRFHLRALRTPREVRNAIAYVLMNARRHLARLDPASSGRWFGGWKRPTTAAARDAPAVATPRTWLLAHRWRKAALLDPSEVPGAKTS
jgi:hypothetical protein